MNTHTTRPRRSVTDSAAGRQFLHDHIVIGTSTQLDNIVANHRRKGTVVEIATADSLPDGRHRVTLRLYDNRPTRPTARVSSVGEYARTYARPARRTRIAIIATAITGAVAGLLAAAAYLIGQLVELIAAHAAQILGVLVLAAIVAVRASRHSGNRHCPGC